jgi:hypothetical protein
MTDQEQTKLTEEILNLHNEVNEYGRKSVSLVIECGKKLTEIKKSLPEGEWMNWQVQQMDKISVSTINRYKRVYDLSLVTSLDGKTLQEVYEMLGVKKKQKPSKEKTPDVVESNDEQETTESPLDKIDDLVNELITIISESEKKTDALQKLYPLVEFYNDQMNIKEAVAA